jgi:hypothetical protein
MYSLVLVLRRQFLYITPKEMFLRQTVERLKIGGSNFTADAPDFRMSFGLFENFQDSPARPFDKTSKDVEMTFCSAAL